MGARQRWRSRVAAWARARQGPDVPPLTLTRRRLYILPTRAGLAFGLLLFVMLIAGLNYSNSLGLALTFLLAGVALVGMYDCHRMLSGLTIVAAEAADAFAGSDGELRLGLHNAAALPRNGLVLCDPDTDDGARAALDLDAHASGTVRLRVAARRRGRQACPALRLETTAPLGLYRCWTWLHLPTELIVYPRPLSQRPLPPAGARRGTRHAPLAGEDEWAALRAFQPGDSPRAVAWKAYARGAPLLVARYEAVRGGEHLFDLATTPGADLEARLSQIAAWILAAEQRRESYGLHLGEALIAPGSGPAHRQTCLRALALY